MVNGPAVSRSRRNTSRSTITAVTPVTAAEAMVASASAADMENGPMRMPNAGAAAERTASKVSAK